MQQDRQLESINQYQEPLTDIDGLAHFLNVHKSWVYTKTRTAKRTGFPVVKVGKYCRFDKRAVLEWLRKQSR